jgi:hypothetical protein
MVETVALVAVLAEPQFVLPEQVLPGRVPMVGIPVQMRSRSVVLAVVVSQHPAQMAMPHSAQAAMV